MSELEQLSTIILAILGQDDNVKKQNEGLLNTLRENDINKYITSLFQLFKGIYLHESSYSS